MAGFKIVIENFDLDLKAFGEPGEPPHHLGFDIRDETGLITIPIVLDRLSAFALAKRILEGLRIEVPAGAMEGQRVEVELPAVELPPGVDGPAAA